MPSEYLHGGRVVIVGGGVIGLSIAFHLSASGYRNVTIVERGLIGEGATAYATGAIRRQFSSHVNVCLVQRSMPFWREFGSRTGSPLDFREHGYLFLISEVETLRRFERNVDMQRSLGVCVDMLNPEEANRVFPGVRTDDLLAATYTASDGSASPTDAVTGYARASRRHGVEIRQHVEFLGVHTNSDGRVAGVRTSEGDLTAELVVLAAGPQTREVGRRCGVDIPVYPHSRQAFATAPIAGLRADLPLAVDMASGAYVHPESRGTAIIGGNDRDVPSSADAHVNWSRVEGLATALSHRFPTLDDVRVVRGWAGLREMTPDDHPIVGAVGPLAGLWVAAGFSGHGFMQSPAVGEALSQWWLNGEPSMDLEPLRLSRFGDEITTGRLETAVF